eukprot:TRINITY_DN1389_c0_g1_i1.p2 TRINITY_DN1389_c0_g1~~TRINITY_DN1389_c0_g1_i1.p2  ORF type:complete len:193 (+),score=19.06 TRINITY_DN1389_c0_g1_i1:25-603(+)
MWGNGWDDNWNERNALHSIRYEDVRFRPAKDNSIQVGFTEENGVKIPSTATVFGPNAALHNEIDRLCRDLTQGKKKKIRQLIAKLQPQFTEHQLRLLEPEILGTPPRVGQPRQHEGVECVGTSVHHLPKNQIQFCEIEDCYVAPFQIPCCPVSVGKCLWPSEPSWDGWQIQQVPVVVSLGWVPPGEISCPWC